VRSEHSRALRLGAAAARCTESELERRLAASHVTVSGDRTSPAVSSTVVLLLETLRRGPGSVHLLDHGIEDAAAVAANASAVDPATGVDVVAVPTGVHVHVGGEATGADVRVLPEGYGVRVVDPEREIEPRRVANGLGIVFSAAVAAGEVFKRTAGVLPELGAPLRDLEFCPVTLGSDLLAAPDLVQSGDLILLLAGLGAVGSATTRILSMLGVTGAVILVDREVYAPENLGTYSLGLPEDAEREEAKVDLAARALTSWTVHKHQGWVEEVPALIDSGDLPQPDVVLCGLDSVSARHAAQRLWPDRLIDASTGDTAVGMIEVREGGQPCLMCLVPEPASEGSAVTALAEHTGLPAELLRHGDQLLADEHLVQLSQEERAKLRDLVGTPICGLADATGLTSAEAGDYRPSVPFVSQQAACLGVGRLVAQLLGLNDPRNMTQYDTLVGPARAVPLTLGGSPGCYCDVRSAIISAVRAARRRG
jgi:molybdopterin/thiamine biosynthesis adenylyltransferase